MKISLTASSFRAAAKELKKYANSLPSKTEKLQKNLAEQGRKKAVLEIKSMANYSSLADIANSIKIYKVGDKYRISTTNFKAPYVEFGTGVKGKGSPHNLSNQMGWQYQIGSHFTMWHGMIGWWYPTTADDKNTSTREVKDESGEPTGEYVAFTMGMPSRPFMYNTALALRESLHKTAEEVFKNDKG